MSAKVLTYCVCFFTDAARSLPQSSTSSLFSEDSRDAYFPSPTSASTTESSCEVCPGKKRGKLSNHYNFTKNNCNNIFPFQKKRPSCSADSKEIAMEITYSSSKTASRRKTTNVLLQHELEHVVNEATSLVVQETANSTAKKIVWDKKFSCLYCKKLMTKLPRHLEEKHFSEDLVKELLRHPIGSVKRNQIYGEIRNKGNFSHNVEVSTSEKAGSFITTKNVPKDCTRLNPKNYLPCTNVLGFLLKNIFSATVRCVA